MQGGGGGETAKVPKEKDNRRVKVANGSIQEGVLKWSGGTGNVIAGRSGRGGENECKEEC
jgi:hypothetical protein